MESKQALAPAPSPERVTASIKSVLSALRSAHGELAGEAEEIDGGRQQLQCESERVAKDRSEVVDLRGDVESKLSKLAVSMETVERQLSENKQARSQLECEGGELSVRCEQMEVAERQFGERQTACDAETRSLEEGKRAVETEKAHCQEQRSRLEPERLELEHRAQALDDRSGDVEARATELSSTREALESLQGQLTRDQKELSVQREQLLSQLGGTIRPPDAKPAEEPAETSASDQVPATDTPAQAPKPAAGAAAAQFRKLRRDAKRKSIGI